jgi:hypothetical protein
MLSQKRLSQASSKYQLNIYNQNYNIQILIILFCQNREQHISKRNYEIKIVFLWKILYVQYGFILFDTEQALIYSVCWEFLF